MKSVFVQTEQTRFWLENSGVKDYECTTDFKEWITGHNTRVAMLELQYLDDDTRSRVHEFIEYADLVLLFIPEFIDDSWCKEFDKSNVVLFLAGKLNWAPLHAKTADCFYFFWSTCDFYRTYPDLLNIPNNTKDKYFDVLLGRRKPHRDALFNGVDHIKNIVTYFPSQDDQDIRNYTSENFVWPDDVLPKPDNEINFTVQEVLVNGVIVSLSQIVPREIYSRTHYTLVAETQNENTFSFFTEKIAKPILARRLFIVASGQHYLKNLRALGFKTFHGIINEEYDNEPDAGTRMGMILEQMKILSILDPKEVANKAQPIIEHNYNVMTTFDWQQSMMNQICESL